jgi:acyl carrier protein
MAEDAIRLTLAYRKEHGIEIPKDAAPKVKKVAVAAAP